MVKSWENAGIHMLEEFICDAIPCPGMLSLLHGTDGKTNGTHSSAKADVKTPKSRSTTKKPGRAGKLSGNVKPSGKTKPPEAPRKRTKKRN